MDAVSGAAAALRERLNEAHLALAQGDPEDAERRAKALTAIVRAERQVAEYLATCNAMQEQDEEAARAELIGRIRRLVEADHAGAPDEVLERIAAGLPE
jgi:hypothetical protein